MATNIKKLTEQVMRKLNGGDPSVASAVHPKEIQEALMQQINMMLRPQFLETMSMGEGSIPEGCVMCTYENVPVEAWNGVSKAELPAIPVMLPKNMGVWRIAPDAISDSTGEAEIVIIAPSPTSEGNSGSTNFVFTLLRSGNTTISATVEYVVTGTGVNPANPTDFTGGLFPSGTVTFNANEKVKTITILVAGDVTIESTETFKVILHSPSAGVSIKTSTAIGTITNND